MDDEIKKALDANKAAHGGYLFELIAKMQAAKEQMEKVNNDDPTLDDLQIVIGGHVYDIGSMHIDIYNIIWQCLDDIQKFAAEELDYEPKEDNANEQM